MLLDLAISDSYDRFMKISVAEAKNRLPELIRAVEAGECVTICRRGVPVVDMTRTKSSAGRKPIFGSLKDKVTIKDPQWWKPMSEKDVEVFLDGGY
jgi:antitoxin (DNA-binding transcriptional repressor) of toxin-antitoxin stability system